MFRAAFALQSLVAKFVRVENMSSQAAMYANLVLEGGGQVVDVAAIQADVGGALLLRGC